MVKYRRLMEALLVYERAIDASSFGIAIADMRREDHPIIFANEAFVRMTGYARDEILGRNCRFLQGEDRKQEALDTVRKALQEGTSCGVMLRNFRKDGSPFWNELHLSPVRDAHGEITHFVGVQNDVTEREEAKAELIEEHRKLEEAKDKLRSAQAQLVHGEKMRSLGQLVAAVAHEVNNPAAFVFSNLHSLRPMMNDLCACVDELRALVDGIGDAEISRQAAGILERFDFTFIREEHQDMVSSSLDGISRIKSIVGELRTFSRHDESDFKMADVGSGLRSTASLARPVLKERIQVEFDLDAELPLIECHPTQLNQAVLNLIMNAGQAIAGKGTITIRTRGGPSSIGIAICDTGSGMTEEVRSRLFEPFFTTKKADEGTGLGLSIVRDIIVDIHGGTIDVESAVGEGTTFSITLPREQQPAT